MKFAETISTNVTGVTAKGPDSSNGYFLESNRKLTDEEVEQANRDIKEQVPNALTYAGYFRWSG